MTIHPTRVTCQKCGWVGDVELVVNAPISVAVASMKAAKCGKCGSEKIGLGGEYEDKPPITEPIEIRAAWWADRGDRGISSNTIYAAMTGSGIHHHNTPHDPDDYNRCRLLLELIPEWRNNLQAVADRFQYWQPMVDAWSDFERLWAVEFKGKRPVMKGLYECIRAARKKAETMGAPW